MALIDHIVAHDGKLIAALLEAHTDDPRRGIRAIFEGVRRRAVRDGLHKACLIAKLTLEIGHVSDEARAALRRAYAAWGGQIAAAIRALDAAEDSLPRDPQRLAMVLLNSWQGALARAALEDTLDPLDDFIVCVLVETIPGFQSRESIRFVSANAWDAYHASAFGLHAIWINGAGEPGELIAKRPSLMVAGQGKVGVSSS